MHPTTISHLQIIKMHIPIHKLKQQLSRTSDKDGQDVIIESIEAAQNEIKKIIKADNVLINQMSDEDMNSLAKFKELNKEFKNKFEKLSDKKKEGKISPSEYNTQRGFADLDALSNN